MVYQYFHPHLYPPPSRGRSSSTVLSRLGKLYISRKNDKERFTGGNSYESSR
jgi:hypothetical protein